MIDINNIEFELLNDGRTLKIQGNLCVSNGHEFEKWLSKTDTSKLKEIDLLSIDYYDSFFITAINLIAQKTNHYPEIVFKDEKMDQFFSTLSIKSVKTKEVKKLNTTKIFFEKIGKKVLIFKKDLLQYLEFGGNLFIRIFQILIFSSNIRWRDVPYNFFRAGVAAVPIVSLILLLIGLITGYQGAIQLRDFGADNMIGSVVAISITRELSPLMVAILVAGRSGSSYAAEIGTMKVSEELDSMKVMGFDIFDFLIMPRVISVVLAIPILTLFGNLTGMIGGGIAALMTLDINTVGYINSLKTDLTLIDVLGGVIKSMIFGFLIASIGCFRGTQVSSGAESVGKYTTSAVVSGVFLIIFTNAIFTFLFQLFGI